MSERNLPQTTTIVFHLVVQHGEDVTPDMLTIRADRWLKMNFPDLRDRLGGDVKQMSVHRQLEGRPFPDNLTSAPESSD